jgi:hypothetical protein
MKVMDAIKRGFEIASGNLNLVLVIFCFNVVWNLAVIPFSPVMPRVPGSAMAMSPVLTILSIFFIFASIFVQGGVLGSVMDVVKTGKCELSKFKDYGIKFYLRLLCLALIIILIIGVVAFLATLIVAAAAPTKNPVVIALITILALVLGGVGIYLILLLFMSPYVLVAEDTGILESMRQSIVFVRSLILKILGMAALLVLIGFGIGLLMGIIAGVISLVIKGRFLQAVSGILNSGVNAYLSVIVTGALITYYLTMKQKS